MRSIDMGKWITLIGVGTTLAIFVIGVYVVSRPGAAHWWPLVFGASQGVVMIIAIYAYMNTKAAHHDWEDYEGDEW